MKLLEFENYQVKLTPEALLVRPIRRIYNADRSVQKEKCMQQLSYLFFMVDPRSTYAYITDLEERAKQIIIQEGLPKDFKPSKELEEAMELYKQHTITSSTRLLESTRVAVEALSEDLLHTKEKLAEVALCSVPNLYRIFNKNFGMSPHNYVNKVRLEKAALLLEYEKMSIAQTAQAVGIEDEAYFSKLFKSYYELSPNSYRFSLLREKHTL